MNQLIPRVSHLSMPSEPWLVAIFGVLPVTLTVALTAYVLTTGWFMSLAFGLIGIDY